MLLPSQHIMVTFGLWQGSLDSGIHTILVEYRNAHATKSTSDYWQTRALTIVYC